MVVRRLAVWLAFGLVSGCGPGWEAVPGGTGLGYDVYRPEPYLMIVAGAPGRGAGAGSRAATQPVTQQYTAQIVYLPDYSTRYRVRSTSGGSNLYIKDGWELSAVSDQNTLSNLIAAATSASTSAGGSALNLLGLIGGPPLTSSGSADAASVDPSSPVPGRRNVALYRIVFDRHGQATGLVRVALDDDPPVPATPVGGAPPPVPIPKATD